MFGNIEVSSIKEVERLVPEEDNWCYTMRRGAQEIVPSLFLGTYGAAGKSKLAELKQNGISHLVCVRTEMEKKLVKLNFANEFRCLVIDMSEDQSETIIPKLRLFDKFMSECLQQNGKALVYCMDGISRGPTLVIAYIMLHYGLSYRDSLIFVQSRRQCVQPSPVLEVQLKEFEPISKANQSTDCMSQGYKRSLEESEDSGFSRMKECRM